MIRRFHIWTFAGFLCLSLAVVALCSNARFLYFHPAAPDARIEIRNGAAVVVNKVPIPETDSASNEVAKAVVEASEHDFGLMNPLTMGAHSFVIRNEGTGPLLLFRGPTTCKCTLSKVETDEIPPGGSGKVSLEWNSGKKYPHYLHEATIFTNDPQNETLHLRIKGLVRMQLGADPSELVFDRVVPGERFSQEIVVYSQVWNDFELGDVQSTFPGLESKPVPLDEATLEKYEARSGYRVRISFPPHEATGPFTGSLKWNILDGIASDEVAGISQVQDSVELSVHGNVIRRLSVYGASVDPDGTVDLDLVTPGKSAGADLLVKVRDEDRELPLKRIRVLPEFLKAEFRPRASSTKGLGLYDLHIECPKDAPECNYLEPKMGFVKCEFDHPRIHDLELRVRFAVVK